MIKSFLNNKLKIGFLAGFFIEFAISKYKFFELEILKGRKLFNMLINWELEGDHRCTPTIEIELLYLILIEISIKDTRHWNYDKKRPYIDDEERTEYLIDNHDDCLMNLYKFIKEQGWTLYCTTNLHNTFKFKDKTMNIVCISRGTEEFAKHYKTIVRIISVMHEFDYNGLMNTLVYNLKDKK